MVAFNIASIFYHSFPFAIGIATTIQVGKLMGDQNPREARRASHVFYGCNTIIQLVVNLFLLIFRDELGRLFSSDEEVANLVARLIPIMCTYQLGDSIAATNTGILRGLGRQNIILVLNIIGFWVVGMTVGPTLAFVAGLDVYGIWWGLVAAVYVTAIIGLFFFFLVHWEEESRKIQRRLSTLSIIPDE